MAYRHTTAAGPGQPAVGIPATGGVDHLASSSVEKEPLAILLAEIPAIQGSQCLNQPRCFSPQAGHFLHLLGGNLGSVTFIVLPMPQRTSFQRQGGQEKT